MLESATDLNKWSNVARRQPPDAWLLRAELATYFIRANDVVCDLGAGAQAIRSLLPPTVGYIPVDCVKERPDTVVVDFNKEFFLPDKPFNVILCLGLLPYIDNLPDFLERLATTQAGKFILFSCGFDRRRGKKHPLRRNHIDSLDEALAFFSRYVCNFTVLCAIKEERKRFLFSGALGTTASNKVSPTKRPLSELISSGKRTMLANVFRRKIF
jgi:hypothetical protein